MAITLSFCAERTDWPGDSENLSVHDKMAVDLARSVARSVNLEPVRKFLKAEAALRFDGDYDILLQEVRHKPVADLSSAGLTFGEVLFGAAPNHASRTAQGAAGQTLLDSLGAMYPLMQIAIPELFSQSLEDWDVSKQKPLVAVLPEDYREGKTKTLRAYDADGRMYEVDADNEPDKLVIVISHNERLMAAPRGSRPPGRARATDFYSTPYFSSVTHDYFFIDQTDPESNFMHFVDSTQNRQNNEQVNFARPRQECHRVNNRYEVFQGIYFSRSALQQLEGWPCGAPEIDVRFFALNPDNLDELQLARPKVSIQPRRRRDIEDRWWNERHRMLLWDTTLHGQHTIYHLVENDAEIFGRKKKERVSGTFVIGTRILSRSVEFQIGRADDVIGPEKVIFCSLPPRRVYGFNCYDFGPEVFIRSEQLRLRASGVR
jgi:hypothetical protein